VVVQEHSTRGFSDLFLIFNLTEQVKIQGGRYEYCSRKISALA